MKAWLLVLLLTSPSFAVVCPKGYIAYNDHCYPDIQPERDKNVNPNQESYIVKGADGKPVQPSRHPEPEWQRMEVKAIDAPAKSEEDRKLDEERVKADAAGQAACEEKYGKGECGPDTGKRPVPSSFTFTATAVTSGTSK